MSFKKNTSLGFIIDKLTNSIENVVFLTLNNYVMKNKIKELDVDIIGGMGLLTEEESKSLSEYFAKRKIAKKNKIKKPSKSTLLKRNKNITSE